MEDRVARLGIFAPLMKAYGQASPDVKQAVDHAADAYRLHLLSAADFQMRIDALLGLSSTPPYLATVRP